MCKFVMNRCRVKGKKNEFYKNKKKKREMILNGSYDKLTSKMGQMRWTVNAHFDDVCEVAAAYEVLKA